MYITQKLEDIIRENNGVITSAALSELGFSRGNLKYLVDTGRLEKTTRGVYILPEAWEDELFNLQARFKKGIYSHDIALFLWGVDRSNAK